MACGLKICRDVRKLCCYAIVSRHFVTKLLAKISVTRHVKSAVVVCYNDYDDLNKQSDSRRVQTHEMKQNIKIHHNHTMRCVPRKMHYRM